jgi:hypothetical protein
MGAATGAACHTLLIVVVGMAPRSGDDPGQWSMYFVFVSAVPVFVMVVVGLLLAPANSRLGSVGVGLVLGALASPALWLAVA